GKRRILELYLNVIEWGDGVYGAEAAAERYYGKPASALDADEAAGLAAMIPNPRRINPRVDPPRFARAQRRVVWLMAHAGYFSRSRPGAGPPPGGAVGERRARAPGTGSRSRRPSHRDCAFSGGRIPGRRGACGFPLPPPNPPPPPPPPP